MSPEATHQLALRLAELRSVTQFDRPGEPECEAIAHSLADMESSFREILESLLPKLLQTSGEELNDVLLDIGEELRHVLYHIKAPGFFGYLWDDE